MPPLSALRKRIASWLDPRPEPLASISARVDDSPGWTAHQPGGPSDRAWAERQEDMTDAFEAWQKSFLVRRVVTLARSYIVGDGITLASDLPEVSKFIRTFWTHPKNHVNQRLAPMLNELIRSGELFPTLHTNRSDGMSYLRFVPATQIREIKTADEDYETELEYGETQRDTAELKWWISPEHRSAFPIRSPKNRRRVRPLMLHYSINKEIGCTRGEGDLGPLLPWAKRYTAWLQDRVRLNRVRTRLGLLEIKLANDDQVELKKQKLTRENPIDSGIYIHGPGEEGILHSLSIGANDASDDGRALRLAVATGANVGLHYLGEGETVNYATAKEMGEPTARYYAERQDDFIHALIGIASAAYHRYCGMGFATWPADNDLHIIANVSEVAREDNESLGRSANLVVRALVMMASEGWIDAQTASSLAFKFAGEPLGVDEIKEIVAKAQQEQEAKREQEQQDQEAQDARHPREGGDPEAPAGGDQ